MCVCVCVCDNRINKIMWKKFPRKKCSMPLQPCRYKPRIMSNYED